MPLNIQPIKISIPLVHTLKNYQISWLRPDILAGIAVAAVAVPQAMAYAQLAGAPLIAGLYAALFAMIVFALFSTSRQVIVGPDAAMAALTGAVVIPLAAGDASVAAALVAILSILIGLSCLAGVYMRLGFIAEFLSRPILLGYMAGLALAVIASQAPKLFGLNSPSGTNIIDVVVYLFNNLAFFSAPTMLLSILLIVLSLIMERLLKKIPVSLFILVFSIAISMVFDLSGQGLLTVGNIPTGLPIPQLPGVQISDIQNLFIPAIAIMLVSYANTIATARSFASKQFEYIDKSQEFLGLGLANVASGVFGGIPVAASGARTAVNHSSKAQTQVSQLFGAITIAVVLIFLASLLQYLPVAALAVIVIMAVSKLFDYTELKSIWHAWRSEAILAIVTVVGVVLLGILQGLLLAVFLAVANLIRKSAIPYDAVLGVADDNSVRDMSRPPKTHTVPGIIMYRFDAPLYFGNANYFRDRVIQQIEQANEPVRWFLWDAETINDIDSSAGLMLLGLIHELRARKITFVIARMKGPIRETISKSTRLSRELKNMPHYTSLGHALEAYHREHSSSPTEK